MKTYGELHWNGKMQRPRGGTILGDEIPNLDELLGVPIPLARDDQEKSFVERLKAERLKMDQEMIIKCLK
jgi:hypothetical protein